MSTTKISEEFKIQRVFPIRIRGPGSTNDTTGVPPPKSDDEDQSDDKPSPPPCLVRHDSQEDDGFSDDPPKVATSNKLETTAPSAGRFVSNTFNLAPVEGSRNPEVEADQKVYRCEDEPIHIPGAIQSFGALIAIRENKDGNFIVRVVSENAQSITGLLPEALFELRCVTDLLIKSDKKEFKSRVRSMREREQDSRTNPDVFSLSLTSLMGAPLSCYIAMHWSAESDLVICEFELMKDIFNPRHPPDDGFPEDPVAVVETEATVEERMLSTTTKSKPLHAVQVARETERQIGSMELFHVLCEIQNQLAVQTNLQDLLDVIVGLVYELTSFHRVMVYQFDETNSGTVVSEIVDNRASMDIYRGLKFPSSDIPKQARDLYLINKIRVLYDRDQPTARLICRTREDAATPLDLTHSYLRAMSPIHIKYLENMGVRATMSISLTVDDKLWGLISTHTYGAGMRVSLPVRELCRALGDLASTNIEKLIYSTRIKARKPLSSTPPKNSPSAYIAASSGDLLNMFGADFGFLAIKGEARTIGKLFAYNEAIVLLQYIRQKSFKTIFSTNCITKDCPEIDYPQKFQVISGMLVIPLALSGSDFLIFFRKGQTQEVQWAGNPYEKKRRVGNYLEPRASFRRWSERVVGRSREWTEDQVESAAVLSTLYGRFIEVWRQKEAIVQKNRMTRILIRNAGHEVRTPLNSIINYLEVALEEVLDERARQHLQRSLQASKSLVFQVNDLLNLTEAEDSEFDVHEDNVDLRVMLTEVIVSFKSASARPELEIRLEDDSKVPTAVRTDPSMLRQVISNLVANAIEHSSGKLVTVGLEYHSSSDSNTMVEMFFKDDGKGMSEQELDSLFQDFEQVLDDEENQATGLYEGGRAPIPISLGLGLAMTARFVRLNCGQIAISSEPGKGTKVSVKIPFRKAIQDPNKDVEPPGGKSLPTPPMLTPDSAPGAVGLPSHTTPGILERAQSLDTILPLRQQYNSALRELTPGPESLVSVAHAVSLTTAPTFDPNTGRYPFPTVSTNYQRVNVLVAEDNPLNSRLLETRLTRRGHDVRVTVDGRSCAEVFKGSPDAFDVILMDLQMPLVDGNASTRLIRAHESDHLSKTGTPLPTSPNCASYGRIPIIAVSASLSEQSCGEYVDTGFDGWILKPIDFTRLEMIIAAVMDEGIRKELLYGRTQWGLGGWFRLRAGDAAVC
ncbi:uncharacterized protein LY89DRAFT_165704 [Mollisia scopiformis]|uniref:Phytochrome n=1 Tax=Mollisia scopiformis TaxID=149040 RepID=A0A194XTM7_MOLSC|nr:uncharacterized protein LY89DRAFT_165704 [Mollisia scopiformis]KUJ23052.1 hypothetical protein LY89DRAFT_165704 [Mollisia scopiformis]